MTKFINMLMLFCCTFTGSLLANSISTESLLKDMINRDKIAQFPTEDFSLKQASSYNRASTSIDDKEGWFTNKDFNMNPKHSNFIRIETNKNGDKEWVLMDHIGAGALVRTWMPKSYTKDAIVRFYFDGESTPTIETDLYKFFSGQGDIPYPLAHKSLLSAVSFFPIPYAKGLKVTLSKRPFFYLYTYREYSKNQDVNTFKLSDFTTYAPLISQVGKTLLNPNNHNEITTGETLAFSGTLSPGGQQKSVALPKGNMAIKHLKIKLGDYTNDPEITRKVILKIEFDGKQTVWSPIGDFFGTGIGLNPYEGWYHTVNADGTMIVRWVMPYQQSAKITLLNMSEQSVKFELNTQLDSWKWDDNSLYFHAGWRGQYPVATRPYSDWNYVSLKGRGVYVGDTLTVMNPVARWWGEGDEKIWTDGESFPSMFGTGTEDYYGYSWGGKSTDFYQHPFHAQPRSYLYNQLNRKPKNKMGERNSSGYSTELRNRSLDTIPFKESLQLDMEIWAWEDTQMGYGVGVYWYGDANTRNNHSNRIKEALNVPPLPNPLPEVKNKKKK